MLEREKQVSDQQKKHARAKRDQEKKKRPDKSPEQKQAGMTTDPNAERDKGYVERMTDKTSKH